MAIRDVKTRLREAFARWNEHLDAAEDAALAPEHMGPQFLATQLAQARSMLDILGTRIGALPGGERAEFELELEKLRRRWGDAKQSYDASRAAFGGELGARDERNCRMALDDVENGVLALVSEMNTRYAGHPPAPAPG
jgi:hypothetical protein